MQLGDKTILMRNPEDIMSGYILEVTDVFEVAPTETYYELTIKKIDYDEEN